MTLLNFAPKNMWLQILHLPLGGLSHIFLCSHRSDGLQDSFLLLQLPGRNKLLKSTFPWEIIKPGNKIIFPNLNCSTHFGWSSWFVLLFFFFFFQPWHLLPANWSLPLARYSSAGGARQTPQGSPSHCFPLSISSNHWVLPVASLTDAATSTGSAYRVCSPFEQCHSLHLQNLLLHIAQQSHKTSEFKLFCCRAPGSF